MSYFYLDKDEIKPVVDLRSSITGGKKSVGRYEFVRVLGRGAFGTVKLAVDPSNGNKVAIKILKRYNAQSERDLAMIEREKKALITLNHPNIVKLLEIIEDEEKQITYLVFEYVSGGELFGYIISNGRLTEVVARKFLRQIVSALELCHYNLIVHRDLKLENLLLDEEENIKITDFGLANFITPQKFTTFCGSLLYAAPEILQGQEYGGPPVDIYALGVILYCLVNGRQPFVANNPYDMLRFMNEGIQFDFSVSKELRDLLWRMLTLDPKRRITLAEIRTHPWTMKNYDEPPASYVPKFRPVTSIDEAVMKEVVALGFEDNQINRQLILKNKVKSEVVTAYQLFLNRNPGLRRSQELKIPSINSMKTPAPAESASPNQPPPLKRSHSTKEVKVPESTYRNPDTKKPTTEDAKKAPKVVADGKQDALDLKDLLSEFDARLDRVVNDITNQSKQHNTPPNKRKVADKQAKRATISGTTQSPGEQIDFDNFDKEAEELRSVKIGKLAPVREDAGPLTTTDKKSTKKKSTRSLNNSANSDTINGNEGSIEQQRDFKISSSFKCDTTSSKSTKEIKKKIVSAAQKCSLQCEKVSKYEFKMTKLNNESEPSSSERIVFDIEIVKMKDFKNLKGLTFKRLEGDIWWYKTVAETFLNHLKL